MGRSRGYAPISSDDPTTCPPLIPPPAITIVQQFVQWSRPPAGFTFGVRPNSPDASTSVSWSSLRSWRSSSSEL